MQDVTARTIAMVIVKMAVRVAAGMDATFIALTVVMRVAKTRAEADVTELVKKDVEKRVAVHAKGVV